MPRGASRGGLLGRRRRFRRRTKADVDPLDWRALALRGPGVEAAARDAAADLRALREMERVLEEAGAVRRVSGRLELTIRGIRRLGERGRTIEHKHGVVVVVGDLSVDLADAAAGLRPRRRAGVGQRNRSVAYCEPARSP